MKNNIPSEYQSFEKLTICSNVLVGVGAIIKIGETEPILVGKGVKFPAIWLKTKTNKNKWFSVVERSISLNQQIEIVNDVETNTTTIKINNIIILKAQQIGTACLVNEMDLRPLGLNIIGNSEYLKVGGNEFRGNTFQGVGTFIGFDEEK